jgi:hypothetical protein
VAIKILPEAFADPKRIARFPYTLATFGWFGAARSSASRAVK